MTVSAKLFPILTNGFREGVLSFLYRDIRETDHATTFTVLYVISCRLFFAAVLTIRGRFVTKVVRTYDPTPLLFKNLAIKYV